ncbi:MAG: COX aromatic rich motif-containing protein [Bradyrhizobiaceae bacterium]|nr:COX aromatic rich motif-containing protein [Bradyrhizobiaceae bacterium]
MATGTTLDVTTYAELARPSRAAGPLPVAQFSPDLFETIVHRQMRRPTLRTPHAPRIEDARQV